MRPCEAIDPEINLTIQYDLFFDDMVALAAYHSERSPSERRRRHAVQAFIVIVFLLLVASGVASVVNSDTRWTPLGLSIAFLPLLCPSILVLLVLTPGVRRWSNKRSVYKAFGEVPPGQPLARQQITLNSRTITVTTRDAEMQADWADVVDISRRGEHAFIFTNTEQTMVVPGRAFPDQAAFEAFMETAKTYRANAAGRESSFSRE